MDPRKEHSNEKQNVSFDPPVGLLLVLTAYVVVLNGLPQAPGLLLTILRGWVGLPRPRSGRII